MDVLKSMFPHKSLASKFETLKRHLSKFSFGMHFMNKKKQWASKSFICALLIFSSFVQMTLANFHYAPKHSNPEMS